MRSTFRRQNTGFRNNKEEKTFRKLLKDVDCGDAVLKVASVREDAGGCVIDCEIIYTNNETETGGAKHDIQESLGIDWDALAEIAANRV